MFFLGKTTKTQEIIDLVAQLAGKQIDMWQPKKKKDMWSDQDKGPTKWREGPTCKTLDFSQCLKRRPPNADRV